jgi:hypothetical protein
MPGAASFEEILDCTLQGATPAALPGHGAGARATTAAAFGFFVLGGQEHVAATHVTAVGRLYRRPDVRDASRNTDTAGLAGAGDVVRTKEPVARWRSSLTPEQHVALGDLQGLGAQLRSDFTRDDLRRTFRALARRYHPDRHPHADEMLKAELSVLFRRLRTAYMILLRA